MTLFLRQERLDMFLSKWPCKKLLIESIREVMDFAYEPHASVFMR